MKKQTILLFLLVALLTVLFVFMGCDSDPVETTESTSETTTETTLPPPNLYIVTFNLNGGTLTSGELTQTVIEGQGAVAPMAENRRLKLTWDKDFSNVTSDMTVNAVWEKVSLQSQEIAAIGQKATVTIEAETVRNTISTGSGFFIDDQGTIVTSFHVIEGAKTIEVNVPGGGKVPIARVISFNPICDLAVLKIDYASPDYLEFCHEIALGEPVYAVGSSLGSLAGSFTNGIVSSVKRMVGKIECIQTNASISPGNSGGPLLNQYGEVVGVVAFSYSSGQNLNLAVKIATLDEIGAEKNYSMNEMYAWYDTQASRSYTPAHEESDGEYSFPYSLVNRYETVTGKKCLTSIDENDKRYSGYHTEMLMYTYDYDDVSFDKYIEYLVSIGFEFQESDESGSERMVIYRENYINGYYIGFWINYATNKLEIMIIV